MKDLEQQERNLGFYFYSVQVSCLKAWYAGTEGISPGHLLQGVISQYMRVFLILHEGRPAAESLYT